MRDLLFFKRVLLYFFLLQIAASIYLRLAPVNRDLIFPISSWALFAVPQPFDCAEGRAKLEAEADKYVQKIDWRALCGEPNAP